MEIGISIYEGVSIENRIKYMKKYGVNRTFIRSEEPDFDNVMKLFSENDIICETLHAPYSKINDMWSDSDEAAQKMLNRLKDSVDKCAKYNIPVSVVHLSSGRPMPEVNEKGIKRYEELFDYAEEKGVTIALENQRYLENISYFMDRFTSPRFCWDNGHEYGFTKGVKFMDLYGDRLVALHIHDNLCGIDTDDHLLPFDGNIDFDEVAHILADSGYNGTLMLEITKETVVNGKKPYADLTDEEYILRAANAVKKLADMVQKYKK